MFRIRRKKHPAQAHASQDPQPIISSRLTVRVILNAVATLVKAQIILAQHQIVLPDQAVAFAPLIHATVTPSLVDLVEHAKRHGLITDAEELSLRAGKVIEIDGSMLKATR